VQLKKCLKTAPAINLKFRPNRLKPADGSYNRIFAIFPSIRIGAIPRNFEKIGEYLDKDKMQPLLAGSTERKDIGVKSSFLTN
jgi:hypothetical protein